MLHIYAEGQCQAWFLANSLTTYLDFEPVIPPQVLRLESICLVDISWISTSLESGCGRT